MNRIKIGCMLLLVMCSVGAYPQDFCFTNSNVPDFLQTIPKSRYVPARSNDTYIVRIFFHIIRRSNGTGGQTPQEVDAAFNILQSDYQPYGICFFLVGVDEIRDDNTYNNDNPAFFVPNKNGDGKFDNFAPNAHSDAIDIYLFANDKLSGGLLGPSAAGIPASALVIGGNQYNTNLVTSHVLPHEVGHCLGLYHTFHGMCGEGGCSELVDGSNCSVCGDFVCDTPAAPQTFHVDEHTCEWDGTTCNGFNTDANGDAYNPNNSLIMAYIPPTCMPQYHTPGQAARMKAVMDNSSILQNVVSLNAATYSNKTIITNTTVTSCGGLNVEGVTVALLSGKLMVEAAGDVNVKNTNVVIGAELAIEAAGDVNVENTNVTTGAKLTLDAAGTTTLGAGFEMQPGAELEIK